MDFPGKLIALRQERQLTQQALADQVGVHVTQLRRYEAGTSQPTLDVLKKLVVALRVSADVLLFDQEERAPDDELRLQFEAISRLDPAEKDAIRTVVESVLVRHEARRWVTTPDGDAKTLKNSKLKSKPRKRAANRRKSVSRGP